MSGSYFALVSAVYTYFMIPIPLVNCDQYKEQKQLINCHQNKE